jgi:hypothetical protein
MNRRRNALPLLRDHRDRLVEAIACRLERRDLALGMPLAPEGDMSSRPTSGKRRFSPSFVPYPK